MRHHLIPIVLMGTFLQGCPSLTYQLTDAQLTAQQICGDDSCEPGSVGTPFHYTAKPYAPSLEATTTLDGVASQIVGRTVESTDLTGATLLELCTSEPKSPFAPDHISAVRHLPPGRSIDYKKSTKFEIDIDVAIEAAMRAISPETSEANRADAKAKLKLAYTRLVKTQLTVTGAYTEWQIKQDVLSTLGANVAPCNDYLKAKPTKDLIVAAGIIWFKTSFDGFGLDEVSQTLTVDLMAAGLDQGVAAGVSLSFKSTVEERLKAKSEQVQVISIRKWRP